MRIELELDESIHQAIKRMAPGVDIEIALSEMLRGLVVIMATHQEEFIRAYLEGSKEDKEIIDEQMRKLVPNVIEKASLEYITCSEEGCGAEFYIPKNAKEVACPSCGACYRKLEAKGE